MNKFIVGLILGFIGCLAAIVILMPSNMVVVQKSNFDFEETVSRIEESIIKFGWSHKGTSYLDESIKAKGVYFPDAKVAAIKLCHPEYAGKILSNPDSRFVSALMPCSIGVWQDDKGDVYISKMNTALIGKLFGGTIADIMGKRVSKDEKEILSAVVN